MADRKQKITDKVLSLLEWLDKKTQNKPYMTVVQYAGFLREIRKRLDEISLESLAQIELNKCDHSRLIGQSGDDFAICLDCGKEINEPLK